MSIIHLKARFKLYTSAVGERGMARPVMTILWRKFVAAPLALLWQHNPKGLACVSCALAKPSDRHVLEFCENGVKATACRLTRYCAGAEFLIDRQEGRAQSCSTEGSTGCLHGWRGTCVRGVRGTRSVVFLNRTDLVRLGLAPGDWVMQRTAVKPEQLREAGPLQVVAYDISECCAAGYYPACNPSMPLWHHAERIKVPAAKSVPVTLYRAQPSATDRNRALPAEYHVG